MHVSRLVKKGRSKLYGPLLNQRPTARGFKIWIIREGERGLLPAYMGENNPGLSTIATFYALSTQTVYAVQELHLDLGRFV
jgi:hypothetical protein